MSVLLINSASNDIEKLLMELTAIGITFEENAPLELSADGLIQDCFTLHSFISNRKITKELPPFTASCTAKSYMNANSYVFINENRWALAYMDSNNFPVVPVREDGNPNVTELHLAIHFLAMRKEYKLYEAMRG